MGVDEPDLPSLYEWAGGTDAVRRMIDAFYDRVEADDLLAGSSPAARLAMHNSRPGADDVVEHAPVPRWGWGVAPPYQG